MTEEEIRLWVIKQINKNNLKIKHIADKTNLTDTGIRHYVHGRRKPMLDTVIQLINFFGYELKIVKCGSEER